jgi:hypothetical protein
MRDKHTAAKNFKGFCDPSCMISSARSNGKRASTYRNNVKKNDESTA